MLWLVLFILGFTFPSAIDMFGIFNCMFGLGIICLLNGLFGIFFVVETRGKSFQEIEVLMNK